MKACASIIAWLLAASISPSRVAAKLSAAIDDNINGTDWCDPLAPCNQLKDVAGIESGLDFGLGLISDLMAPPAAATYQYQDVTPAAAVDWRKVLTQWSVLDQGICGK